LRVGEWAALGENTPKMLRGKLLEDTTAELHFLQVFIIRTMRYGLDNRDSNNLDF
jgi:hypothetical protein